MTDRRIQRELNQIRKMNCDVATPLVIKLFVDHVATRGTFGPERSL